jgi:hypothetical protein
MRFEKHGARFVDICAVATLVAFFVFQEKRAHDYPHRIALPIFWADLIPASMMGFVSACFSSSFT